VIACLSKLSNYSQLTFTDVCNVLKCIPSTELTMNSLNWSNCVLWLTPLQDRESGKGGQSWLYSNLKAYIQDQVFGVAQEVGTIYDVFEAYYFSCFLRKPSF
jgi:hypothetical protein